MDTRDGLPRLTQLFPTDGCKGDTTIDIIAVHGIETHSPRTWMAYEQDEEPRGRRTNWLCDEDMLPRVIPQARIWAYDYNSNCYSDNAQRVDILGLGDTLLEILCGAGDKDVGRRLLIFIGSCFGGIVVAQALERASRDQIKYAYLLRSTAGVVFLGTPLRGTATASIAEWVALIRGFIGKETSRSLLQGLKDEASSLDTLVHDFSKMAILHKFQIRCFYETRTTQILNALSRQMAKWLTFSEVELVSKASASLDGHKRIPLEVRHGMMNKFRGPDDVNFALVSSNLKEIVDNARARQGHTKEELKCLQCLTSNYREDKDRNKRRVPGTCEWFLEHKKFRAWRQKDTASLLWVSADPGCGKSVLSRTLVDEDLLSPGTRTSSVCYFFFKDDDANRQSGACVLSAILHQLFVQKPALLRHAKFSYENNGKNLCIMFGELWDILMKCANDPEAGEIICVLDALDECKQPARGDLIAQLSSLYSARTKIKLKFLVTSRPYYEIGRSFYSSINDVSSIHLEGESESDKISKEIDLVIEYQIPRISKNREYPLEPGVQDALVEWLKKVPHRTYLWLHLILDVIQKSLDSTKVRLEKLISELPRTVEDAYEKILKKIEDSDLAKQARRLFHIIVAAVKPLTLREMNIALAIDGNLERGEPCQSYKDLDLEPIGAFRERIRNVCGFFVSIIDARIYLIHQTAKEFLISKNVVCMSPSTINPNLEVWRHSLIPAESHLVLVKICLSYLLFQELNCQITAEEEGPFWNRKTISRKGWNRPPSQGFLYYAASHWHIHYHQSKVTNSEPVLQSILSVCDTQSNRFRRWSQVSYSECSPKYSKNLTNLMVASFLGLEAVFKLLLQQDGVKLNLKDDHGRTALSWAAYGGRAEVVKLLLEHDGVELNLRDSPEPLSKNKKSRAGDQMALMLAAEKGHLEVVRLLLEQDGVELNIKDEIGSKALMLAAREGHLEVVKLLLEQDGVELNIKDDENDRTALMLAAEKGHLEVVRLLLEQDGVELNIKINNGHTALMLAAEKGHLEVVRLLLEQDGVELNIKDDENDRTALLLALEKGHLEVVKLLLEQDGVELNIKNKNGHTALILAAEEGHLEVVKLLLVDGVKLNIKYNNDRTALVLAAEKGHLEVVRLLLEQDGVELNIKNQNGSTALMLAAREGHLEVVKLLLEQDGVDLNYSESWGSALSQAAGKGHLEVVKVLLAKDSSPINQKDYEGHSALFMAAQEGRIKVVKLLLEHDGIEIRFEDRLRQTPLSIAARNQHLEVVKLLLDKEGVNYSFSPGAVYRAAHKTYCRGLGYGIET